MNKKFLVAVIVVLIIVVIGIIVILSTNKDGKAEIGNNEVNVSDENNNQENSIIAPDDISTGEQENTIENSAPSSGVSTGEFDKKNVVLNGQKLVFGKTTYNDIKDSLGKILSDKTGNYINSGYYDYVTCYLDGNSESTYYVYFYNSSGNSELFETCPLYAISIVAKSYTSGGIITDGACTFDLGSGITETITKDEALAILGEPTNTYENEEYNLTEYTWGSTVTEGYKLELKWNNNGLCEMTLYGEVS